MHSKDESGMIIDGVADFEHIYKLDNAFDSVTHGIKQRSNRLWAW